VSSHLDQCVNARKRFSAVRKLLHDDRLPSRRLVLMMTFRFVTCLRTSLCLRLTLKSAIASQLIHIAHPPPDPVCSYPFLQLVELITSLEVSKRISIIPPKSYCYDQTILLCFL